MNEPVVERAAALIEVGRGAQAVEALLAAGVPDEGSTRACCVLAQAAIQAEDWRVADRAASMALARTPDSEWALRLKAMALMGVGLYAQAEQVARQAVAVAPGLAAGHATLARCLFRSGKLDAARDVATTAIEIDPANASTQALLGHIQLDRRDDRSAKEHLTRSLELDPLQADVLNNLGVVAQRHWRYLLAARLFRQSLVAHPLPLAAANLKRVKRILWIAPLYVIGVLVLAAGAPMLLFLILLIRGGRYSYDRWIAT